MLTGYSISDKLSEDEKPMWLHNNVTEAGGEEGGRDGVKVKPQ